MKPEARLRTELGATVMGFFLGTPEGLELVLRVGLEGAPTPAPAPAPAPEVSRAAGAPEPGPGLPPLEPRGDPLGPPG
jgi:hypothetical protein